MLKMVQEFMVVCCFSCQTFQVHQVKKSSNKWICKICRSKQSVQKVYGQGRAADCRKHVQKLNMLRGRKESSEQQMLNHPPEDYAETFEKDDDRYGNEPRQDHPVLLTGVGRKWKLFTEPRDSASEEESEEASGLYTTDNEEFREMTKRKRRGTSKRSSDDPNFHPLSKATHDTSLLPPPPPPSSSYSHAPSGPIHPYSDVSDEMGVYLSGLKSTKSCYLHSSKDRYQRLKDEIFRSDVDGTRTTAKSVQNLYTGGWEDEESVPATVPEPRRMGMSQEEKIASIRKDISRFSCPTKVASSDAIPVESSRWSKFMNESEEEGDIEGEEEEGEGGEGFARYKSTVSNPETSGD